MYKVRSLIKRSPPRNLKLAVIAFAAACVVAPVSGAMAQSHGGGGVHGGGGGFRGGYGGFHGYGGRGFGFYFGGPYLGWPYYYGAPYGYPYPYGYYYPYPDDGYLYPPQQPMGSAAAPENYWYYCDNPKGYYPYISSCNGQWREVSPTPPAPPRPSALQVSPEQ